MIRARGCLSFINSHYFVSLLCTGISLSILAEAISHILSSRCLIWLMFLTSMRHCLKLRDLLYGSLYPLLFFIPFLPPKSFFVMNQPHYFTGQDEGITINNICKPGYNSYGMQLSQNGFMLFRLLCPTSIIYVQGRNVRNMEVSYQHLCSFFFAFGYAGSLMWL